MLLFGIAIVFLILLFWLKDDCVNCGWYPSPPVDETSITSIFVANQRIEEGVMIDPDTMLRLEQINEVDFRPNMFQANQKQQLTESAYFTETTINPGTPLLEDHILYIIINPPPLPDKPSAAEMVERKKFEKRVREVKAMVREINNGKSERWKKLNEAIDRLNHEQPGTVK